MRKAFALSMLLALGAVGAAEPAKRESDFIFDSTRGLGAGWMDFGWSPHKLPAGKPVRLDLAGYGGWVLAKPGRAPTYGALVFRYLAPALFGSFLAVRLESGSEKLPDVHVGEADTKPLDGGWREVTIPFSRLNPSRSGFDKVVIRAARDVGHDEVMLDDIALTPPGAAAADPYLSPGPSRAVQVSIECGRGYKRISPFIYGVGFGIPKPGQQDYLKELGTTARRWGGNPSSRYNWKLGNAWNTGSDWFFQNTDYGVPPGYSYAAFLDEDRSIQLATALTLPTLGWVAKDTRSASFPASVFGRQQRMSPNDPSVGNGLGADGKPLVPPSPGRTSVPLPPEGIEEWVRTIHRRDAPGSRSVKMYILDNEPGIWHATHRDVHPQPLTYDELLEKTIAYGSAVRRADPGALIAGPAEWGWASYLYSGADLAAGILLRPDRRRHGDKPIIPWLLGKVHEHERKTGVRVLDVLDVHYYPQFQGAGEGLQGETGPEASARRIRSTRSLWDSSYRDESWINDTVRLIPRLHEWIEENDPGLGISIGEWNFGAEEHMSGGLAVAEVLGHFGIEGVSSAFYWDSPPLGSAAFNAFRAYGNYDGRGAHFLEQSIPAHATDPETSVFASRSADGGRIVAVLLNINPAEGAAAQVRLASCGDAEASRRYGYAGGPEGLRALAAVPLGSALQIQLPPYSLTVLELQMSRHTATH